MKKIDIKDKFLINSPVIASRIIEGQAIIVVSKKSIEEDRAITLNNTGTRIWGLLGKGHKVEDIIKILCSEYKVVSKKAEKEVIKFLSVLLREEAICSVK